MNPLRQRMPDDMQIRNFARGTQESDQLGPGERWPTDGQTRRSQGELLLL